MLLRSHHLLASASLLSGISLSNARAGMREPASMASEGFTQAEAVNTYFELTRHIRPPGRLQTRKAARKGRPGLAKIDPDPDYKSQFYSANLTIDGQVYVMAIDTGSSDTWLVGNGFQQYETAGGPLSPGADYGHTYTPGEDFHPVTDVNFNINYGTGAGGSFITGTYGIVPVTLGGITVNQQIGVASLVPTGNEPISNGFNSGNLGLAYPALVRQYKGTNRSANTAARRVNYDPIIATMIKSGKIAPFFSLALSRESSSNYDTPSYLALGGRAPVLTVGPWASSPIQYVTGSNPYDPRLDSEFQFYSFTPDGFLFKGSKSTYAPTRWYHFGNSNYHTEVQCVLDSGTNFMSFPETLTDALAAQYSPPAIWNEDLAQSSYVVSCDAIAPYFAIQIGGVIFEVDKRDMIIPYIEGNEVQCVTSFVRSIGDDWGAPNVLGTPFLWNVEVIHDIRTSELRLASRGRY